MDDSSWASCDNARKQYNAEKQIRTESVLVNIILSKDKCLALLHMTVLYIWAQSSLAGCTISAEVHRLQPVSWKAQYDDATGS
jgi:hypothetical protein